MDLNMYENPSTQSNVKILQKRGVIFAGPEQGRLASGKVGRGRLMEPNNIIDLLKTTLGAYGDFAGKKIIVTAGPTVEHIDPVRMITNPSSGKMGFALATASRDRGAAVTLISGPTSLESPFGITKIDVKSAKQIYTAVLKSVVNADILIMAAAVSDFRPKNHLTTKEKKSGAKTYVDWREMIDKEAIDIYSHLLLDDLIYLSVEIIKIIKKTAINISFLANREK